MRRDDGMLFHGREETRIGRFKTSEQSLDTVLIMMVGDEHDLDLSLFGRSTC
jgi:hypothetical protein